jgi:hypothetical protein
MCHLKIMLIDIGKALVPPNAGFTRELSESGASHVMCLSNQNERSE